MDNKFYTDNIEQLLKEKSDEFRMYPSKRVWHSIYNDLHPSRKWPSVAMSMLLVIALLLIGYLNTGDNSSRNGIANTGIGQPAANTDNNTSPSNKINAARDKQQTAIAVAGSDNNNNSTIPVNTSATGASQNSSTPDGQLTSASNAYQAGHLNNSNPDHQQPANARDVVAAIDNYISSNQLLAEVATMNNKNKANKPVTRTNDNNNSNALNETYAAETNKVAALNTVTGSSPLTINAKEDKQVAKTTDNTAKKLKMPAALKVDPNEEKAWIEDYALHNKSKRKKWKDLTSYEFYVTPGLGYRKLENIARAEPAATSLTSVPTPQVIDRNVEKAVTNKPSLGLEAGVGISYSFAKKFRLKAGVQLNYTSYAIKADETYHPTLTTLMLNDLNTGYAYLDSRSSTLSNKTGTNPVTVHNRTYQVSVPVGLAVKLAGNKKVEWYAGGSLQPTFMLGGKAHLVSSDYQNYVEESSMLRKWNLNTSLETYINYKVGGMTLQVGPQFRYQVLSSYNKKYTIKENLYNAGLKVGIVKGF